MNEKDAIFINVAIHSKYDNYIYPELVDIIIHHLLANEDLVPLYLKPYLNAEKILSIMVKDDALVNDEVTEEFTLNKIIKIAKELLNSV